MGQLPPEVIHNRVLFTNFARPTGNHLWWSLFFMKCQGFRLEILLKKDSNRSVFLQILTRNLKNIYKGLFLSITKKTNHKFVLPLY